MAIFLFLAGIVGILATAYLALNGFLGPQAQAATEDQVLKWMGESRGSYFLKHMTPLKDQPLHKQTDAVVDAGQATYDQAVDAGTGVTRNANDIASGAFDTGANVGGDIKQGLVGEKTIL